jgi:hypothetical protein
VVAIRYVNGLTVVRFAHPGCSPSAVLRILRDATPVRHRVRAACWLRPALAATSGTGRGGGTAVLLVDNQVRAWDRARARLAEELYPQALRAAGLAPWSDLATVPAVVPGLTATIIPLERGLLDARQPGASGTDAVVRVTRRQAVVFDGCLDVPDAWGEAARSSGRVLVVAGTALTDPGPTIGLAWTAEPDRLPDALGVAVGQGRVWAGVATVDPARPRRRHGGTGARATNNAVDSSEPGAGIPGKSSGVGGMPDMPVPPNPAATARETSIPDWETVSTARTEAVQGTGRWLWSGYRARYSGRRRWA